MNPEPWQIERAGLQHYMHARADAARRAELHKKAKARRKKAKRGGPR